MSNVDDHGLEVIKKAAEYTDQSSVNPKKDYYFKMAIFSKMAIPVFADAFTVEYPSNVIEIYKFRQGGKTGAVLKTVTLEYSNSSKKNLISGEFT